MPTTQDPSYLTVIAEEPPRNRKPRVRCRCRCGRETVVDIYSLRSGHTKSCGCLNTTSHTKHGQSVKGRETSGYRTWQSMVQRCTNARHKQWASYGGRGITVCERWLSFEKFISDVGQRPSDQHSIERIRNNEGYSPDNCRWATKVEQANNRRTNRMVEFRGRMITVAELARLSGVRDGTVRKRLDAGWSPERATLPVRGS